MLRNNSYNSAVSYFVIGTETIIAGGLFFLMRKLFNDDYASVVMDATGLQIGLTLMLIYAISAATSGVVLYKRKIYAYEIMSRIMSAMLKFILLSYCLLKAGNYMNTFSTFYLLYILILTVLIVLFRVSLRIMIKSYRTRGGNIRFVVLVGSSRSMTDLYGELTDQKWAGYNVLGYFDFEKNENMPEGCEYLGTPEDVTGFLEKNHNVHYLFCGLRDVHRDVITRIISFCENHIVRFYSVPNMNNYLQNKVYLESVGSVPVLSLRKDRLSSLSNKIIKRAFDLVFSTLFLCTLFPVILIIVTIITKITMPGPVFFRQKRNGLNDKEFYCLKFRSMKVNADADRLQATKDDPRKTKWGNIMRKTNIDELPQFINVFMGDMSVVGPRPHMLKHTIEYSKLIDKYMVRHLVKPGITGWSQVTGFRGETKELKDMQGRIRGDIWYIENWSFWLDLYIIYRTVANVFKGEEKAY